MIPLTGAVKIYFCRMPVNLHRSFDGLPGAVEENLKNRLKDAILLNRFISVRIYLSCCFQYSAGCGFNNPDSCVWD